MEVVLVKVQNGKCDEISKTKISYLAFGDSNLCTIMKLKILQKLIYYLKLQFVY